MAELGNACVLHDVTFAQDGYALGDSSAGKAEQACLADHRPDCRCGCDERSAGTSFPTSALVSREPLQLEASCKIHYYTRMTNAGC